MIPITKREEERKIRKKDKNCTLLFTGETVWVFSVSRVNNSTLHPLLFTGETDQPFWMTRARKA